MLRNSKLFVGVVVCALILTGISCRAQAGRLVQHGQLVLTLPDDCPHIPSVVVYEDGSNTLYVLNELENRIDAFNLGDRSCSSLKLAQKPNFKIDGFGKSGEKLFLFNYRSHLVYYYEKGSLVKQFNVSQEAIIDGKGTPEPYVQTLSPFKLYGSTLIMTGFRAGEASRRPDRPDLVLSLLDLKSGRITNAVEMPEVYGKYNWGGGFSYRFPCFELGPDGEVVCSFAATEEIASYSMKSGRVRHSDAPSRFFGQIEPYSKTDRKMPSTGAEISFYRNSPSYDGILYDPWNEVYYRIALRPEREGRRGQNNRFRKPVSIIILDKDLRPLGETPLSEDIYFRPYCSFVTSEGLYMQVLTGDENHMTFYRYQYEKAQ